MNKQTLIQKIKSISDLTYEEQAELINLVNNTKKYGLVWEDKFEQIEEDLLTNLPVLTEMKERFIEARPMEKPKVEEDLFTDSVEAPEEVTEAPNHILIEGDNLHALTTLSFTHKGEIDLIYIDPPYNTGNKDFRYNDKYVDSDDTYRHSKWLSFMQKRLLLASELLNDETGLIFISIDDNEQSQLKLLCDEIFYPSNFIGMFTWIKKKKGSHLSKTLRSMTEYILCYSKNIKKVELYGEKAYKGKQQPLVKRTNAEKKLLFPSDVIHTKLKDGTYKKGQYGNGTSSINFQEDFEVSTGKVINPITVIGPFVWSQKMLASEIEAGTEIHLSSKFGFNVLRHDQDKKIKRPSSLIDIENGVGTNEDAYEELVNIFHSEAIMSYPKPTSLISYVINMTSKMKSSNDFKVLDFFAGSGTTLHATMQLNSEDGGNRQCILVTNNENNICEEVTYERNKRVIQGYTNAKGVEVPGLTNNNLRYYKCDYVPSARTEANRRRLTEASTDLLCIKEDCYDDVTKERGLNPKLCRLYTNKSGKYLAIVYHSRSQHEVNEQMCEVIAQLSDLQGKVKLYGFSPEIEVLLEDFFSVKDRVHAVPLPDAIYNAYRSTFKSINLGKRKSIETAETDSQVEETDLFNQATTEA